jgi:hypothetical protein
VELPRFVERQRSDAIDPAEPAYTVDFPISPEIITSRCTLPEAFANACEALGGRRSFVSRAPT